MNTNSLPLIYPVACHTDNCGPGTTFVVIKGMKDDGINYIVEALKKGASTIVLQEHVIVPDDVIRLIEAHNATIMRVANSRKALAELSAQAYNYPARTLKIIGITGTKGKTTTAWLLHHIFLTAGIKVALLSTVKNKINAREFKTELTTQQPDYLHNFFDVCVRNSVEWVIMEVAAQALSLCRVEGIIFDGVIFTNFNQEHGEFYATIDDYFAAKKTIFSQIKPTAVLLANQDDDWCKTLKSLVPDLRWYGKDVSLSISGNFNSSLDNGTTGTLTINHQNISIKSPALVGDFNTYNIMAACAMSFLQGIEIPLIQKALNSFPGVLGRLNRFDCSNGATAFIDHAHTPVSFQAVLSLLAALTHRLIVVFGAGGDRDTSKRPLMGAIAAQYAQMIILTTDNPRSENPAVIVQEILGGIDENKLGKVLIELDREKAIQKAYQLSGSGSIIILLGKGSDEYQIIGHTKTYFSERAILRSLR